MRVQALCDSLVANDAAGTEFHIDVDVFDDAELKLILAAAKKNMTLKKVILVGRFACGEPRRDPVAVSLASVVSEHPRFKKLGSTG
jgi:hypothetical protein